ncbi:hypothetical protein BDD12DRAFT_884312 [Trichophaea hybrida]|nr:hypothetical protein BDD12DRAFT_884312 [Trichophaea hybrida]
MAPIGTVSPFPAPAIARIPLDELQINHPIQFSLFIRALDKLMKSSEAVNNPYGWFQFAGIHGLSNIAWDSDSTPIINNDDSLFGYCTHGGSLFPLWHRIYLWELEYQNPSYWDWATNRGQMPTSVNKQFVDIIIVGETQTEQFQSPLLCYTFQNNESSPDGSGAQVQGWFKEPYASEWKTTLWCPDSNGNSNPDRARSILDEQQYIHFSTAGYYDRKPPPAVHYASLEKVHNIVHLFIGGDPNVDDKLDGSMLNPTASFIGSFPSGRSAITDVDTPESASTGLVPFKRPVGSEYWISQEIQHLAGAEFNESIPEGVRVDRREWQVASRIDRFAAEGSFYIHFYLGDVPDAAGDYVDWVPKDGVKSNYVGSNAVFSSRSGCANCERQREAGRQVIGVTSLTDVLLALKYDLNDVKGIEERLKTDLNWVVQKTNGEVGR